ncbi:hypothetical protein M885DRAFT_22912 [Pelagophyceae sp. CCMP2097]|nr:hypothetical protein M885DRAFT_22912 [Pelagophyceae sp. CCMP2097]
MTGLHVGGAEHLIVGFNADAALRLFEDATTRGLDGLAKPGVTARFAVHFGKTLLSSVPTEARDRALAAAELADIPFCKVRVPGAPLPREHCHPNRAASGPSSTGCWSRGRARGCWRASRAATKSSLLRRRSASTAGARTRSSGTRSPCSTPPKRSTTGRPTARSAPSRRRRRSTPSSPWRREPWSATSRSRTAKRPSLSTRTRTRTPRRPTR